LRRHAEKAHFCKVIITSERILDLMALHEGKARAVSERERAVFEFPEDFYCFVPDLLVDARDIEAAMAVSRDN
jgi:hypothetical protein